MTATVNAMLVRARAVEFRPNAVPNAEADRGRDEGLNLAPPSEPDGRFSRIRLSSR
jgi:hypothetical protein